MYTQAAQELRLNNTLLQSCMTGMIAPLRPVYTPRIIVLQTAPYLVTILQPTVKLVVFILCVGTHVYNNV
jgi:hypothetical protein